MENFYAATLETALRKIWLLLDAGRHDAEKHDHWYPATARDAERVVEALGLIPDEDMTGGDA